MNLEREKSGELLQFLIEADAQTSINVNMEYFIG